jgi:hypothetical protein
MPNGVNGGPTEGPSELDGLGSNDVTEMKVKRQSADWCVTADREGPVHGSVQTRLLLM